MQKIKSLRQLKYKIDNDPEFLQHFTNDPIRTINEQTDPSRNPKVFRTVLYIVGAALIFSIIIASVISLSPPVELIDSSGNKYTVQRSIDQFFIMIGSAAIGALAGLLVPRPD